MNPIQEPLNNLFEKLNIYNGMLFILESQLNNYKKMIVENYNKHNLDISRLFAGASLAISDLTECTQNGWPIYYASGRFSKRGEEYVNLAEVFIQREATWTITMLPIVKTNFLNF